MAKVATKKPEMAKAIIKESKDAQLPARIKLASPYGFYDEDGTLKMWQAGHDITDAEEIALLISHAVTHEVLE